MKAAPAPVNPSFGRLQDTVADCDCPRHVVGMAGKDKAREERLAAALRENLRRRKAQSREVKSNAGRDRD